MELSKTNVPAPNKSRGIPVAIKVTLLLLLLSTIFLVNDTNQLTAFNIMKPTFPQQTNCSMENEDVHIIDNNSSGSSFFDEIVNDAFQIAVVSQTKTPPLRRPFQIEDWNKKRSGGLLDVDRTLLGKYYGNATSVFEYGLGESTLIADHVGVPRYAGIDSDANYVAMTRSAVNNSYFRFYFADVGNTGNWGYAQKRLHKNVLNYQLAPLVSEPSPFDVYMVDGRWRLPCLLASFLHASARGAPKTETTVLIHDCSRGSYHQFDKFFNLINRPNGSKLCIYKRKPETTDKDLRDMWRISRSQDK